MSKVSDADKILIIDRIISLVPEIKKKRTFIVNQLIVPKSASDDTVLERIEINGRYFYKDKYKGILDETAQLVGVWQWNFDENKYNYFIFEDEKNKIDNIKLKPS